MQPRCAMRFESHIPKSLAMRFFFASDAKTHPLDLKSQENARKKSLRKSCDVGLRCEKSACFLRFRDAKCLRFGLPLRFGLRCEHSRYQIASDVGRAMRTTKHRTLSLSLRVGSPKAPNIHTFLFRLQIRIFTQVIIIADTGSLPFKRKQNHSG